MWAAESVTEPLEEIRQRGPKPDQAIAIGPAIMMKFCCDVTKQFDIQTQVSLNTIMVDGTVNVVTYKA